MNITRLNIDIAEAVVKELRKRGAMTTEEILAHFEVEATKDVGIDSVVELIGSALGRDGDISQINGWLREHKFPMATLVRLRYFTGFRRHKDGRKEVPDTEAPKLVAGAGPGTVAAGIVVDEPLIFDAAREFTARKANGMTKTATSEIVRAVESGKATPAEVEGAVSALGDIRGTLGTKEFAEVTHKALPAAKK